MDDLLDLDEVVRRGHQDVVRITTWLHPGATIEQFTDEQLEEAARDLASIHGPLLDLTRLDADTAQLSFDWTAP